MGPAPLDLEVRAGFSQVHRRDSICLTGAFCFTGPAAYLHAKGAPYKNVPALPTHRSYGIIIVARRAKQSSIKCVWAGCRISKQPSGLLDFSLGVRGPKCLAGCKSLPHCPAAPDPGLGEYKVGNGETYDPNPNSCFRQCHCHIHPRSTIPP